MFMSSNESRKGTIDESDHIDISNCDQFPQHSSQKAFEPIDVNIGVGIDEAIDGADKSHTTNDKKEIIHCHRPNETPPRLQPRAKAHFYQFYSLVNEFSAIYNNFYNNRGSGWSDETVLEKAHEQWRHINKTKKNKNFKYEHVWKVFKNSEKYVTQLPDHHASKKPRNFDSREFNSSPSPNPDSTFELDNCEVRPRPMGQKAAKRKGKFKAKETMDDNTQWNNMLDIRSQKLKQKEEELRQKDIELRQKDYEILFKDTTRMLFSLILVAIKIQQFATLLLLGTGPIVATLYHIVFFSIIK
ncbi:hypothetical protein LXL04_002806 [Taraxacum kok-saghyz]